MAKSPDEISSLEQRVMLALTRLHPNGYGVNIQDEIEARTGRVISFGSIYASLDRLKERGFVESREGNSMPERGGRKKVLFVVTGKGQQVLAASLLEIDRMRGGVMQGALI